MSNESSPAEALSRTPPTARRTYDHLSPFYDLLNMGAERRLSLAALQKLAPRPGEVILEIGPGTGHALVTLARSVGPTGQVAGLDISPAMLRVARARLARAGLSGRVALHLGDALLLPYPASSFDAIFMSFTLELFSTPHIPLVLSECQRLLRPGGRLALVCMSHAGPPNLITHLYLYLHRQFPTLIDCRPIPAPQLLTHAGFAILATDHHALFGLPVDTLLAHKSIL